SSETIRGVLPALATKARVVLNGVDAPTHPSPARESLEGPLSILYIGRLSPRKGPDLVIQAAEELQRSGCPVTVALLGSAFTGYEWFEQELRELAAKSSVPIDFLG